LKIRADEHIAPVIVESLKAVAVKSETDLTSVLGVGIGQKGMADVHWISDFAKSGGTAILTADTDFVKTPPQVDAVFRTGIKVIHLPNRWAQSKLSLQTAHLLIWWNRIEAKITEMKPRECFSPKWNISEEGELQKVQLDFAKAQLKLKRKAKKAR
jgi:PIN like domain